jgi:prepilin-type processing-associated H-X9-DG protein
MVRHAVRDLLPDGHQPGDADPGPQQPVRLYAITTATSLHPGGCNFAFCDGSVRFLKKTISSWTFNTNNVQGGNILPDGATYANYVYSLGTAQLGVYQQLSTRAGGEVVSSDSY